MEPVKLSKLDGSPFYVTGIRLRIEGYAVVASIETDGKWVDVIVRDINVLREQSKNAGIDKEGRESKRRTEEEMREALNRFCNAAWGSTCREESHIFSIPPQNNDADMILGDAIDELIEARKIIGNLMQKNQKEGQ